MHALDCRQQHRVSAAPQVRCAQQGRGGGQQRLVCVDPALEQLEAAFYSQVVQSFSASGLSAGEQLVLNINPDKAGYAPSDKVRLELSAITTFIGEVRRTDHCATAPVSAEFKILSLGS